MLARAALVLEFPALVDWHNCHTRELSAVTCQQITRKKRFPVTGLPSREGKETVKEKLYAECIVLELKVKKRTGEHYETA